MESKIWYKWVYPWNRNRLTDTENGLVGRTTMRQDDIVLCCVQSLSRVRLLATPWTVAHQVPWSLRFPRQEYWSGLPLPSPGDLPNPGIQPGSLVSPVSAAGFFTTVCTWEVPNSFITASFFFFFLLKIEFVHIFLNGCWGASNI